MGVELVLGLLGGLILFMYGMQVMSANLEAMTGNHMEQILERLTAGCFLGVLVGAGIVALIQSSSATTVMTVGLISSGLMTLKQTMWIIMGANADATATGQLIVLDIEALTPLIVSVGVMSLILSRNRKVRHVEGIIASTGILFIGMGMIGDATVPLRDSGTFIHMTVKLSSPFLGILVGAVFMAIIQPSLVSVGILQALIVDGVINLHSAVFVLFGQSIGTCITALLASVGTSCNAKRTTLIHLMSNVIGTALFVILYILIPSTDLMVGLTPDDPMAQTAGVYTIFNINTAIVLPPFGALLEKIAIVILPDKAVPVMGADQWPEGPTASKHRPGISTIAINQIYDEIKGVLATATENVSQSFRTMEDDVSERTQAIADQEEEIDLNNMRLFRRISKILVLGQTLRGISTLSRIYTILGNTERIGDHATNSVEYAETIEEKGLRFSNYAKEEFAVMEETYREDTELLMAAAAGGTQFPLLKVVEIEQWIDGITRKSRQNRTDRMRERNCNAESSILYSEMLTGCERIGDHMLSIIQAYDVVE